MSYKHTLTHTKPYNHMYETAIALCKHLNCKLVFFVHLYGSRSLTVIHHKYSPLARCNDFSTSEVHVKLQCASKAAASAASAASWQSASIALHIWWIRRLEIVEIVETYGSLIPVPRAIIRAHFRTAIFAHAIRYTRTHCTAHCCTSISARACTIFTRACTQTF